MGDAAVRPHRRLEDSLPPAALWAGIAFLLAAEMIEYLRNQRRQTRHRIGDWWAEVERKEHRATENAEIAVLARRLGRPRP